MALKYFLMVVLTHNMLMSCASAAVHSHVHVADNLERESDGSYRPRDADHYDDLRHNAEFDHEAILGSVREAEEFDNLSPSEAKAKLEQLLLKMDLNGDKIIEQHELKKWVLNSFATLSREEAEERMQEADENRNGAVEWLEYLQDTFGADNENLISAEDTGESGMFLDLEKLMWKAADSNGDGSLDLAEFEVFSNPEEHSVMHPFILNNTMREKDTNNDGRIDFKEFIGERGAQQDTEWLMSERAKYNHEFDQNGDGFLDIDEIKDWIIPDNEEIADEEVSHLFAAADDDQNGVLSFQEIVEHYDVFVGSDNDSGGYGPHSAEDRFSDEL